MANVTQEYVLKVTSQGLKEIVREIKALRKDLGGLSTSTTAAEKGFRKVSKSAGEYDRNQKGAANATNNSTKAFSKMSQGMQGTLVPAYATVAANVFALTAAFGALERAADVQTLIRSSEELASQTGVSLKLIAADMQEITKGAISMKEGLTQAALATSAGFDSKSIQKLTEVAKNASLALGRDMTDAMNRVFKGAIKAEPELLDELGIILRLDPAVRKYAASLNKSVKELTTFEKQQAILNEVVEQGQEKFSLLSDVDPNPYTQLAASFGNVTNSLLKLVNIPISPVITFFAENTGALTAAFVLFANTVLNRAIPALTQMSSAFSEQLAGKLAETTAEIQKFTIEADVMGALSGNYESASDVMTEATKSIRREIGEYADELGSRAPQFTKRYEKILGADLKDPDKLRHIIKSTDKELKKLSQSKEKSTKVNLAYKEALESVRANAIGYLNVLQKVQKGETNVATARSANIAKYKAQTAAIVAGTRAVKLSFTSAFSAGLSEGIEGVSKRLAVLKGQFAAISGQAKITTVAIRGLATTVTYAGGAIGIALKTITSAIPIFGQIYLAIELLRSGFSFLTDFFNDAAEESAAATEALEKFENTVSDTAKAAAKFKARYKGGIFGFKDELASAEAIRNSINNINSTLEESILLAESYNETFLEKIFGTNADDLKESLEDSLVIYEAFGLVEIESLRDQLEAAESKEDIIAVAKAFQVANKSIIEANDSAAEFGNSLKTSTEELDKALSNIATSFVKLSNEQKAFAEISAIISTIENSTFDSLDILANSIGQLGDSSLALLGISAEHVRQINEYAAATSNVANTLGDLRVRQEEMKNVSFLSFDEGEYRALQGQINSAQAEYNRLTSDSEKVAAEVNVQLLETQARMKSIISAKIVSNAQTAELQFQLKNNVLSYQEELDIISKLNSARVTQLALETQLQSNLVKNLTDLSIDAEQQIRRAEAELAISRQRVLETENVSSALEDVEEKERKLGEARQASSRILVDLNTQQLAQQEKASKALEIQRDLIIQLEKKKKQLIDADQFVGPEVTATKIPESYRENIEIELSKAYAEAARLGKTSLEEEIANAELRINFDAALKDAAAIGKTFNFQDTINEIIELSEGFELYNKQQEILEDTGETLDSHADKERILNDLLFDRQRRYLETQILILEAAGATEQALDLTKALSTLEERRWMNLVRIRQEEKTASDKRAQALKKANDLAGIQLYYVNARTLAAKKELAVSIAQAKIGKDISKEEEERIKKLENSKGLLNLREGIKGLVDELTPLTVALEELQEVLDNEDAQPFDKQIAGMQALVQIGEDAENQMAKGFGQVAVALQQLQLEGDDAVSTWKVAEGVISGLGTAFEGNEKAMQALQVIQDALALRAAIVAVLSAGQAPPPANFAAMAAVAATAASLLSSIGVAFSGGVGGSSGGAAEQTQAYQDSFGDNGIQGVDMQSNALVDSIDQLMETDYALSGNVKDLRGAVVDLKNSMDNVAKQLFEVAGSFSVGDLTENFGIQFGQEVNDGIFSTSTTTTELLAAGLELGLTIENISGELVGSLNNSRLFITKGVTEVTTGLFGGDTDFDIREKFIGISDELADSITDALNDALRVISLSADQFGINLAEILGDRIVAIDPTKINLKDKSPSEQANIISGFLSHATNEVLDVTIGWIKKFSKAGEELTDTLFRLTKTFIDINNIMKTTMVTMRGMTPIYQFAVDSLLNDDGTFVGSQLQTLWQGEAKAFEEAKIDAQNDIAAMESARTSAGSLGFGSFENIAAQIAAFDSNFETAQDVINTFQGTVFRGGADGGRFDPKDKKRLLAWYDNEISDMTKDLNNMTKKTWGEFILDLQLTWQEALLENFEDDPKVFAEVFDKFAQALFSPEELADIAEDNARFAMQQARARLDDPEENFSELLGGEGLIEQLFPDSGAKTWQEAITSSEDLRVVYDYLADSGAFAGENGADLYAVIVALGGAFYDLDEAVTEVEDTIDSFLSGIQQQIRLFGLEGRELDFANLYYQMQSDLEEAGGDIEKIAHVEALYALKRLEIVKQYHEETVDALNEAYSGVDDAMLEIVRSSESWNEVAYQSLKIEKIARRLLTKSGGKFSSVIQPILDSLENTGRIPLEETFGQWLNFSEELPENINDEIELANQLKDAIMDRYNAEEARLEDLKALSLDIKNYLDDLLVGDKSPLTNLQRFNELSDRFAQDLVDINSTDSEVASRAANSILTNADALLTLGNELFAIGPEYQDLFDYVYGSLKDVGIELEDTIVSEEEILSELQITTLEQLAAVDGILDILESEEYTQFERDLIGVLTRIPEDAIPLMQQQLDRLDTNTWQPMKEALETIATNTGNIPQKAVGDYNVGFDQLAMIHQGEMIIPAEQAQLIRDGQTSLAPANETLFNPGVDNSDVVNAINILTQVVAETQEEIIDQNDKVINKNVIDNKSGVNIKTVGMV